MPKLRAARRSPRVVLASLTLTLAAPAACRRPERPAAPASAAPGAAWRALAARLDVRDAATPSAPLRWTVPRACPLTYQYSVTMDMRTDPMRTREGGAHEVVDSPGIALTGEFAGRTEPATPDRWDLHVVYNRMAFVQDGARNPGVADGPDGIAAPLVRTNGARWTEDDGPTALWSAYGSFPGIALFFPDLPGAARPGSEARWSFVVHTHGAGVGVEARRRGAPAPDRAPPDHPHADDITVRLERWITVAGQRAAVLAASWRGDAREQLAAPGTDAVGFAASYRGRAHYVVLASGRLLHAAVERDEDTTMTMPDTPEPMRQHSQMRAEARLVSACEGPTLPRIATAPRSAPELATDAYARLLEAVERNDVAAAGALLAPALTAAHDASEVLRALRETRARFGDMALTPPVMANGFRIEGLVVQFDSGGVLRGFHGSARASAHVTVRVEVGPRGPRVLSIVGTDGADSFLEASPAALEVAAPDAPDAATPGG